MGHRRRFHLFSHEFGVQDTLLNASRAYLPQKSRLGVVVTNGLGLRISAVLRATHKCSSVTSNSDRRRLLMIH